MPPRRTFSVKTDSFVVLLSLKFLPADMAQIGYAYYLAQIGHRGQLRDSGESYFSHVRATAMILFKELGIIDAEAIIIAFLHDILEKSNKLTLENIKSIFGARVADFVAALSKPRKNDQRFISDGERRKYYYQQLAAAAPIVKLVKLADRLHNMRTLEFCKPEKQERQIAETREIYFPFIEAIAGEYPDQAKYLKIQLETALARIQLTMAMAKFSPEVILVQSPSLT